MQKDSSETKRILDGVEFPTPMKLIEPRIFKTNFSTADSYLYEVMKPRAENQLDKKYYKLKYVVDTNSANNETGTFI